MHWLDSAVQIGRRAENIHGIPLRTLRKDPMTTQSLSPSPGLLGDSSDQGMQSQAHKDHTTELSKPHHSNYTVQRKNRYSSSGEELKVIPLYDTGLAKGSTVKVCVLVKSCAKFIYSVCPTAACFTNNTS